MRSCPNPHCDLVCQQIDYNRVMVDILCHCGTEFCFQCGNSSHSPVSCDDAMQWLARCERFEPIRQRNLEQDGKLKEREAMIKWLKENVKQCPSCQAKIEKTHGCNHMTCKNCSHHFCWECHRDWSEHGEQTGGFFECYLPKQDLPKVQDLISSIPSLVISRSEGGEGKIFQHYYEKFRLGEE